MDLNTPTKVVAPAKDAYLPDSWWDPNFVTDDSATFTPTSE